MKTELGDYKRMLTQEASNKILSKQELLNKNINVHNEVKRKELDRLDQEISNYEDEKAELIRTFQTIRSDSKK